MKSHLLALAAAALLSLSPALYAQTGVIAVSPQGNPDGSMLTMRDAVRNPAVYPQARPYFWTPDGTLSQEPPKRMPRKQYVLPESEEDGIVYGDTYSRNEFGIDRGIFPSNGGDRIAVVRKDERAVTLFPLLDINTRTGSLRNIRYPMNGMPSEKLSLLVCDMEGKVLSTVIPDDFTDERYLTGITWSPDDKYIFIQVLDREQHNMVLNMYRVSDASPVRTILEEHNDAWVEPLDPLYFLEGSCGEFIYRTDNRDAVRRRRGFR